MRPSPEPDRLTPLALAERAETLYCALTGRYAAPATVTHPRAFWEHYRGVAVADLIALLPLPDGAREEDALRALQATMTWADAVASYQTRAADGAWSFAADRPEAHQYPAREAQRRYAVLAGQRVSAVQAALADRIALARDLPSGEALTAAHARRVAALAHDVAVAEDVGALAERLAQMAAEADADVAAQQCLAETASARLARQAGAEALFDALRAQHALARATGWAAAVGRECKRVSQAAAVVTGRRDLHATGGRLRRPAAR